MKKALLFLKKNIKWIFIIDVVLFYTAIGGMGAFSEPAPVKQLKVSESTYSSVALDWENAENADGYRIYRSDNGKDYKYIESTIDSRFEDKNLVTGKKYSYIVAGRNGFKLSELKKKYAIRVTPELEAPEVKLDTSKGKVELKISEVDGATGYEVSRDGKTIGQADKGVFVDQEAKTDTVHKYAVKAFRYKNSPVYSKPSKTEEAQLHGMPNVEMSADSDEIFLKWGKSEYYDRYEIYNGNELLGETYETGYTLSNYSADKIYDIKLLGFNTEEETQSPAVEKRIKVFEEPLDNEAARQAACDWAVDIANDNSFTYGTGSTAHRCGCYFCGTNRRKKGSGYEKTYCCNPFVHAAYSHGAQDPQMLRDCQDGDSVGMKEREYTKYGNWERHSKPSVSDLQMGDVLVGSHHVMLYIGDGKIAHAAEEGWGADTIRIDNCSSYYSFCDFVMRYTGTGSGSMYKAEEVDEKGEIIKQSAEEKDESEQ